MPENALLCFHETKLNSSEYVPGTTILFERKCPSYGTKGNVAKAGGLLPLVLKSVSHGHGMQVSRYTFYQAAMIKRSSVVNWRDVFCKSRRFAK